MNKDLRDKWLTALRSGEYQQSLRTLYDPNFGTYCCLGVLACVAGHTPEELVGAGASTLSGLNKLELLGLTEDPTDRNITTRLQEDLWMMNDIDERSFVQIANWIEENVEAA